MNATAKIMIEEATKARNATHAEMMKRVEKGRHATRDQIKTLSYYNTLLARLGA